MAYNLDNEQQRTVDSFEVAIERTERGWIVVTVVDGVRTEIGEAHSSERDAQFYAKNVESGATRYDDAASIVDPKSRPLT